MLKLLAATVLLLIEVGLQLTGYQNTWLGYLTLALAIPIGLWLLWGVLKPLWDSWNALKRSVWAKRDVIELSSAACVMERKPIGSPMNIDPQLSRLRSLKDAVEAGQLQVRDMRGVTPNALTLVTRNAMRAYAKASQDNDIKALLVQWDSRNPPKETKNPEPEAASQDDLGPPPPDRTIRVAEALDIVIEHFKPEWGDERAPGNHVVMAAIRLREAAARGHIVIEGRREINRHHPIGDSFSEIWVAIPKDFWLSHKFDLAAVLDKKAHSQACETQPENPGDLSAASMPGHAGLRVSETEVKHRWPEPR